MGSRLLMPLAEQLGMVRGMPKGRATLGSQADNKLPGIRTAECVRLHPLMLNAKCRNARAADVPM